MNKTWRQAAAPIIAKVLEETKGLDEKQIRKALHDAYPFGARQWHPYKIWCDEIKVQRGKRTFGKKNQVENNSNQLNLL